MANPSDHYQVSRWTLWVDRFMGQFIRVGGLLVIAAVAGIFVFILAQILPLFRGATVTPGESFPVPAGEYAALLVDEWGQLPVLVRTDGQPVQVRVTRSQPAGAIELPLLQDHRVTAITYHQDRQELIYGTATGQVLVIGAHFTMGAGEQGRQVSLELRPGQPLAVGTADQPVRLVDYVDAGSTKMAAVAQEVEGRWQIQVATFRQRRSLLGAGKVEVDQQYTLDQLPGQPQRLLVGATAETLLVACDTGDIGFYRRGADGLVQVQQFRPFPDEGRGAIRSMDFLFGKVSLVLGSQRGESVIYSLYIPPGKRERLYGLTKRFPALPEGSQGYAPSIRNKAFLLTGGHHASLRYGTTAAVRWSADLPFVVRQAAIVGKYQGLHFLGDDDKLHTYALADPHPEAGFAAFFSRLWYEGYADPGYEWQSTGGTDDFEAKLSMIPVIIGTLKGTLYAMLFAVPIALLGALYTSQFQRPAMKTLVKPTLEIMASLPSVVLGFLAALWLAPLIETRVPSLLLFVILLPTTALLWGWVWGRLPGRWRLWCPQGCEFLGILPLLLLVSYGAWQGGPWLERLLFVVRDPETGRAIADFRLWWPQVTGTPFSQRNALVVGFMMGFAVIPIVFTIAEDALSNVPRELTSASLALGASRWQTAVRVVLPTASAGIFSACMIGFGRAVGETMIVLMATGNTPVMDLNIFTGFRTLSANIAVELPEAPHGGTLYRALFLGAFLLFAFTFVINTVAEVLRQHLRQKYKTV
jgi:phosphate transport system permease protein